MSSFFDSLNFHDHRVPLQSSNNDATSSSSHSILKDRTILSAKHDPSSVGPRRMGPCASRSSLYPHETSSLPPARLASRAIASNSKDDNVTSIARRGDDAQSDSDETTIRDEAPRVFWNAPPSTFIRDWAKANPPDPLPAPRTNKKRGGPDEGDDIEDSTDHTWSERLLHSASKNRGDKWRRQASTASTSSTTSNSTCRTNSTSATSGGVRGIKDRTSTMIRRSKSLRNSKTTAGFRRHASSSAVLGGHANALASLNGVGENQTERVNKLLADLGLAFQEEQGRGPDYQDEREPDASMDSTPTICAGDTVSTIEEDEKTPVKRAEMSAAAHVPEHKGSPLTPSMLSISQRKALGVVGRNSVPTSSWERTLTFPPSGSPASGIPQSRTGEAIEVVRNLEESEDEEGFGYSDWDEALLIDLPLLSGIEEDHEGYFSGSAGKQSQSQSSSQSSSALQQQPSKSPWGTSAPTEGTSSEERDSHRPDLDGAPGHSDSNVSCSRYTPGEGSAAPVQFPRKQEEGPVVSLEKSLATPLSHCARSRARSSSVNGDDNMGSTAQIGKVQVPTIGTSARSAASAAAPPRRQQQNTRGSTRSSIPDVPKASKAPLIPQSASEATAKSATPSGGSGTSPNCAGSAACPKSFYGAAPSSASSTRANSSSSSGSSNKTTASRSLSSTASGLGLTSRPAGLARRSLGVRNGGVKSSQKKGGRDASDCSGSIRGGGGAGGGGPASPSALAATSRTTATATAASPAGASRAKAGFKVPSRRPVLSSSKPPEETETVPPGAKAAVEDQGDDSFGDLEGLDGTELDLDEIDKVMSANGY